MKIHTSHRLIAASIAALSMTAPAVATERGQLRALLGLPGQDLTSPAMPGFYVQANYQHYYAGEFKDNEGNTPVQKTTIPGLGTVSATQDSQIRADVLALRASWVSETQLWDGRVGVSATLPLIKQTVVTNLTRTTPLPPPFAGLLDQQIAAASAANTGSESGLGDMEIAPFVDWQTDSYRVIFAPAIVAPVGSYDKDKAINTGAGNFWTFRPVLTFGYVTENGWEFGTRATYSFNTENSDTKYTSGQYLHADGAAMYQIREGIRLGAAGYLIYQTTDDKSDAGTVPNEGNKARVFSLGPQVSWQSEDSTVNVEFKVMQEFGVRNRPEGTLGWLRLVYRLN
ncbi:transporter [Niveibacterium sp. 24ML]|uniref:SphA family protein n=1 Tax=Niveibacterium sp. 24ML TaxID=2985512 RepID=UPI0022711933|nr:transporter [Niveibacterium sp. 24ML]MCX9154792.1 transporter [Niveibacterium sp. 24ML]